MLATGYNVVDVAKARELGIPVCNIPTYGTAAVAQMAFAHLLEICQHVAAHSDAVRKGEWARRKDFCFWDYPLIELADKTMGIIGFGRIGQAVGKIARAFGMKVIFQNGHKFENDIAEYVSMDELFSASDVISLHCPQLPSTEGIINSENIAKMKDGDNPLFGAKNCFITPHISWAPIESRIRLMNTAVENLKSFLEGKPINVVNDK